jgi:hypothetical protein
MICPAATEVGAPGMLGQLGWLKLTGSPRVADKAWDDPNPLGQASENGRLIGYEVL